jgi:hypothetical protein
LETVVKTCVDMSQREKDTAKQVRDTHLSNAMVGDAKVIMPGADKVSLQYLTRTLAHTHTHSLTKAALHLQFPHDSVPCQEWGVPLC